MSRRLRSRPLIIAHRGASAVAPEGTRAAIRAAVRAGADMVELDVQMTRDGRLVIFHDDRLERTTNGTGHVSDIPYARFARLDAGSWFHVRFAGEHPLLVSQALRVTPRRMGMTLELKRTPRRRALLQRLLRLVGVGRAHRPRTGPGLVRGCGMSPPLGRGLRCPGLARGAPQLLISSFDASLLRPLRSTGLSLALICRTDADHALRRAIQLGCSAWHPLYSLATRRRIATAHAAGLRVHAWTVDEPSRARRLIRWGIDGLFTNDPARLRRLIS